MCIGGLAGAWQLAKGGDWTIWEALPRTRLAHCTGRCSPKSRTLCTRRAICEQGQRGRGLVGMFYIIHFNIILWNDTFWIYTIQARISMKSCLQLQLKGLDGVGDLLLVQEGVRGRRPASLLLLHHAAVSSGNGSPFRVEWIFKN